MTTASDLPAGRELDALVAEKVMGWTFQTFPEGACPEVRHWHRTSPIPEERSPEWAASFIGACPPFSTDIAAAWTVVEKLRSLGFGVVIDNLPSTSGRDVGWTVAVVGISTQDAFAGTAHTAPLAICRAALSAVKANP